MSNATVEYKNKYGIGLAPFGRQDHFDNNFRADFDINTARQRYVSIFRKATHANLKTIIAGLIEARSKHDLDDDSFSEIMEIVLAHYIENEVSSRVDDLLSRRLETFMKFGLGKNNDSRKRD